MVPNFFTSKKHQKYECEKCNFKCSKKGDWNRHLSTNKHINLTNPNIFTSENINKLYTCKCGKAYKHMSTLCAHNKKCNFTDNDTTHQTIDKDNLITLLVTQNKELIELLKHGINNTNTNNSHNTNTNTNSNNKTFNINFFLNETCKNAMNISDFVSSINVTLEDLEYTGRQGYIQGVSNIILNNLQKLEQHERPLHCNDLKREILYIKENNKWEKETEQKPILTKAIKTIANENIKQIKHWRDKYPDCTDSESKKNNMYLRIVSNSMNGLTEEEGHRNIDKIISNVAKEVVIDKE
jgi:hypothetical protein